MATTGSGETPDIEGGGRARYGETSQQAGVPVPSGAGPTVEEVGEGEAGAALGGTGAGNPLAGVTAEEAGMPSGEATDTGTPDASEVVSSRADDRGDGPG
jgi:hypothetical protein